MDYTAAAHGFPWCRLLRGWPLYLSRPVSNTCRVRVFSTCLAHAFTHYTSDLSVPSFTHRKFQLPWPHGTRGPGPSHHLPSRPSWFAAARTAASIPPGRRRIWLRNQRSTENELGELGVQNLRNDLWEISKQMILFGKNAEELQNTCHLFDH